MADLSHDAEPSIDVEVCFALPGCADRCRLRLPPGARVCDALAQSGVAGRHPSIDLTVAKVGIWGRVVELDQRLQSGDRVEIYRPLHADPRDARRAAAQKAPARGQLSGRAVKDTPDPSVI